MNLEFRIQKLEFRIFNIAISFNNVQYNRYLQKVSMKEFDLKKRTKSFTFSKF
jgi:hypothetical protein